MLLNVFKKLSIFNKKVQRSQTNNNEKLKKLKTEKTEKQNFYTKIKV